MLRTPRGNLDIKGLNTKKSDTTNHILQQVNVIMNGAVLTNFAHVFSFRIAGNKYRGLAFSLGKKANKHR